MCLLLTQSSCPRQQYIVGNTQPAFVASGTCVPAGRAAECAAWVKGGTGGPEFSRSVRRLRSETQSVGAKLCCFWQVVLFQLLSCGSSSHRGPSLKLSREKSVYCKLLLLAPCCACQPAWYLAFYSKQAPASVGKRHKGPNSGFHVSPPPQRGPRPWHPRLHYFCRPASHGKALASCPTLWPPQASLSCLLARTGILWSTRGCLELGPREAGHEAGPAQDDQSLPHMPCAPLI